MLNNKELEKSPTLSVYDIILKSLTMLGVRKFSQGGKKYLRSYQQQRNLFDSELEQKLLSAFAGNPHFNPETYEGKATKLENESISDQNLQDFPILLLNKNDAIRSVEDTKRLFDFIFQNIEEIIFLVQRKSDIHQLKIGPSFPAVEYLFAALPIICSKLYTAELIPLKSSPFLYLTQSLIEIRKNNYNVTATIKAVIRSYLDQLCGDRPKHTIALYTTINSLNEEKNQSRTLANVFSDIKTLLQDLSRNPDDNFSKTNNLSLSLEQKDLIYEMWGQYNALIVLSRLRSSSFVKHSYSSRQFLKKLHEHVLFTNHIIEYGEQNLELLFWQFISNEPNRSIKDDEIYGKLQYMAELYRQVFNTVSPARPKGHSSLKSILESCFDEIAAKALYCFDDLTNQRIDTQRQYLDIFSTKSNYPDAKKISSALCALQKPARNKNHDKTFEELPSLLEHAPYFLKRFISIIYVGSLLSKNFAFKNNTLNLYISTYLASSLTHSELTVVFNEESDIDLFYRFQDNKYDLNYGLIRLISDYNRFITHNHLDMGHLVNPLKNINSFLDALLATINNLDHTEASFALHLSTALTDLKPKLKDATITSIEYSLLDLKSPFILQLTGLLEAAHNGYEGTAAILKFLELPSSVQEQILECLSS